MVAFRNRLKEEGSGDFDPVLLDMKLFSKLLSKVLHDKEYPGRQEILQNLADEIVGQLATAVSGVIGKPVRTESFGFGYHEDSPERVAMKAELRGGTKEHELDGTAYTALVDLHESELLVEQHEPEKKKFEQIGFMLMGSQRTVDNMHLLNIVYMAKEAVKGKPSPVAEHKPLTADRIMRNTNN